MNPAVPLPDGRPTVETYLRELAGTVPADSKRTVVIRLARPIRNGGLDLSVATLYRYLAENDTGESARVILDVLGARRAAGRERGLDMPAPTIDDYRNLTAGRGAA